MQNRFTVSLLQITNKLHSFGMVMQERSFSSPVYRRGFNGKEKDNEINVDAGDYDFGARIYDCRLGRWLSLDPLKKKLANQSNFVSLNNNPIYFVDPDGCFSIKVHYLATGTALIKLGFSKEISMLVAHYASIYADHPSPTVMILEGQYKIPGIDYSKTEHSQDSKSIENSTWHSMKADGENISNEEAMARGQEFGWDKIIDASEDIFEKGGVANLKRNSAGIENLGQGIHALQDALAHKGTNMQGHDLKNDVFPSEEDKAKAQSIATNAIIVSEVLSGIYTHVTDGMTIDLSGTSKQQFDLIKAEFQIAKDVTKKKVTLVGEPKAKKPK